MSDQRTPDWIDEHGNEWYEPQPEFVYETEEVSDNPPQGMTQTIDGTEEVDNNPDEDNDDEW